MGELEDRLYRHISHFTRRRRKALLQRCFPLTAETEILDLGSSDGSFIHGLLEGTPVRPENVTLADISSKELVKGHERYGYQIRLLEPDAPLPFADQRFDLVHCSSVIEHVTIPRDEIWNVRSGSEFATRSLRHQREFAGEIRRVARMYFVQTPDWRFPIETHSWLPLASFLPRRLLILLLRIANRFWLKHTAPDFHLLRTKDLRQLFPDATITVRHLFGFPKELIAVRTGQQELPAFHPAEERTAQGQ